MKKYFHFIYIIVIMFLVLVLGISSFFQNQNHSNEDSINNPQLFINGKINENILDDIENYLSHNFGFRNELLQSYTLFQQNLFLTSPITNVVIGEEGYLYFKETVDDYIGNHQMTSRELFQIRHTIELLEEYVHAQGADFLFVVAPNKNSLYDFMPYNYIKSTTSHVTQNILENLSTQTYIDLFALFESQSKELYYKTDTHWNNEGACLVYNAIMNYIGKEHDDFSSYSKDDSQKMKGDLYNMLYPDSSANETVITYNKDKDYEYLTKTRSTEQNYIETINDNAQGSLLMFRDSFANNLIEFFSDAYHYAIYDKSIPYNLFQMNKYSSDTVIIEIAERNIDTIQTNHPLFLAPEREMDVSDYLSQEFLLHFDQEVDEEYVILSGIIDEAFLDTESLIYVKIDNHFYELIPQKVDNQYGFFGCVPKYQNQELEIYLMNNDIFLKDS